jgi:hypothetical protein
MRRSRRSILILLALVVVGALMVYAGGWPPPLPTVPRAEGETSPAVTRTSPADGLSPSPRATSKPPTPLATDTPIPPSPGLSTPADEWANALLDQLPPTLAEVTYPADGLAWWQSSSTTGEMTLTGATLALGDRPLEVTEQDTILISIPDEANPSQLNSLGAITVEGGVLVLSIASSDPSATGAHWLLSDARPALALRALTIQAELRDLALVAAFARESDSEAQLVLVEARSLAPQTPISSALEPGLPTPTPSRTPTSTPTTTPTRMPDAYLGRVMAEKIDPVIDMADRFNPGAVFTITTQHPWTGLLTWTETGARINARQTAVEQATELTFYTLNPDDASGTTSRLFTVVYVDGATRFPDDLIYFQGQRMEEMLFWLVRHAAERGGQLLVAYDDFGTRQALIVVGFRPFSTPVPPPSPTSPPPGLE